LLKQRLPTLREVYGARVPLLHTEGRRNVHQLFTCYFLEKKKTKKRASPENEFGESTFLDLGSRRLLDFLTRTGLI